ncbi:MAG TPA: VWA domain-containing protein [Pyrinomonadaceae bacterium]|nr:VWA domain-containing protein [Pyrinomonadaceae bacterium]
MLTAPNLTKSLRRVIALATLLAIAVYVPAIAGAQEVAETIRVKTRVVFLDALVKDKRTGAPIADLTPENFEVLDNGNQRPISYFTRDGQARKPLALVLVLDLRDSGAGRFLKRPEILKTITDELAKLGPKDEVAILAVDIHNEDAKRIWLTDFTRDPAQLAGALMRAPQFMAIDPEDADEDADNASNNHKVQRKSEVSISIGGSDEKEKKMEEPPPPPAPPSSSKSSGNEIVRTEVNVNKKGGTVTRSIRADGTVDIKRTNKKGNVELEISGIYDMAAAVQETIQMTKKDRPNSQLSIIWVSDGIVPILHEDRAATEQLVLRENVIFNSMTVELRTLFKFLLPIAKPVAGMVGLSVYGSAKRLAQLSGGEAVKISRVKDYSTGLSRIIGNLTARYSLGFSLSEDEMDDGRLHNLEVRVKAKDAKGKTRKLEVSARKGYYMSETPQVERKVSESALTREW